MRFFAPAFSLVLSAALAAAQTPAAPVINTPEGVQECFKTLLTWTATTAGPFQIQIVDANTASNPPVLEDLGSTITGTSLSWLCKEAANTRILVRLRDTSTGQIVTTAPVTVNAGNPALCAAGGASSGASSAASAPATTDASQSVVATTAATSPAASIPGTTPAPTTAGGNTGTSKPQSSNTSKTSSSAASAPSGGAGQLKAPVALAVSAAFAMALFA